MPSTVLSTSQGTTTTFRGFENPDANFVYCPNQFFDVCLPHCSRGAVRFVAYLLRRILGWRDENGNPIEENISVPHQDFIDKAGISKGAIGSVSDEVIARGFVCRTQRGKAKSKGSAGQTATYRLRWDERGEYLTDPNVFQGFYAGGGHCSPIPNAFFDQVVPFTRLGVTKIVGTVLRYTVGFEAKYGGRRQQASLALTFIQRFTNIKDRTTAVGAVKEALDANFIRRVHEGYFDNRSSVQRAAIYAPRWLDDATNAVIGSKTLPVTSDRYKNPTSIGSKTRPADRFKNQTSIKTDNKDTLKQQQTDGGVMQAAAEFSKPIQILCDEGFDEKAAQYLAKAALFDEIQKQIMWIDLRKPENRLGMLRTAIEQKWGEPIGVKESEAKQHSREREQEQDVMRAARKAAIDDEVRRYNKRRKVLLADWRHLTAKERKQYHSDAIAKATTDFDRTQLRRHTDLDIPPMATLEIMALTLGVAKVS